MHDLFFMLHNAFYELNVQARTGQSNELLSYQPTTGAVVCYTLDVVFIEVFSSV
jgi:hypothetical protein